MPTFSGALTPGGVVTAKVIKRYEPLSLPGILQEIDPMRFHSSVRPWKMQNMANVMRGLGRAAVASDNHIATFVGVLRARVVRANGMQEDYGVVSLRVVTTAGVNFIVGCFTGANTITTLKYHGIGTGSVAEAAADTALGVELSTQYNPDNTRATGTTVVGASNNIYETVGTNTVDAAAAITEHGIFSQAATGGGTLLDRSVFAAINLSSGDGLQTTYDLTFTAGS